MFHDQDIPATYTNGALRPEEPLNLPEGAHVTVSVRPNHPTPESRARGLALIKRIRREGLIRLVGMRWTRDDLYDRR